MKQLLPGLWELDEIGHWVHCYLWAWSDGLTLIDTGFPQHAPLILDALRKHGHPLHSIKRIITTHVDLDHTGGLPAIKRATQASIVCHAVEKEFMENPKRRYPAAWFLRLPYWVATNFLPQYHFRPAVPDELVVDGQVLPEGFTVIHTPGHTPGHISLLHREKRFLITGDALSNRGGKLRSPLWIYTPDRDNALRSIWKLAKRYSNDYEVIAFGHGPPIMQNGGRRVKALASQMFSANI